MKELQEELKRLERALKAKTISVNEYCSFYHQTAQKIKALNQ